MQSNSDSEGSGESSDEGVDSTTSSQLSSGEEENVSKSGVKFTGTSPYEEWCCLLKYDGDSQNITASGVIVKLNYPPEELHSHLPSLRPMNRYTTKYGSVQTSYILITCHHTIPGMPYLKGWSLDVSLGKPITFTLDSLVCGAVSCCGENGFILSGPLKPAEETAVFSPHLNARCLLDLDFTILFLNSAFEKHVLSRKGVQTEPPEINLDLKAESHQQLQLYRRERNKVVYPFRLLALQSSHRIVHLVL